MRLLLAAAVVALCAGPSFAGSKAEKLAETLADDVRSINEAHAKKPGDTGEPELAAKVSKKARKAVDDLVALDDAPEVREALVAAGEAALDLDLMELFEPVRTRLEALDPDRAHDLGVAVSRERFLARGIGGLSVEYMEHFADVLDAVLDQYDATFGFAEWSKVPGKKLRVRVHLEDRITRPPHFAPQFPFHSEVVFPVADASGFTSPTPDGKFLFYGLCHELGHVIAMWGDRRNEEDHHAWAHYTGVVIVEEMASAKKAPKWMKDLRDVRWRSLEKDREKIEKDGTEPSKDSRDGVMALLIALHDSVGPAAIGAAINHVDAKDERLRINHVRYYSFDELRDGLLAIAKGTKAKKKIKRLLE
jgi:hypothetical protein